MQDDALGPGTDKRDHRRIFRDVLYGDILHEGVEVYPLGYLLAILRAGEHQQPVLEPQNVEEVDYTPLVGRKRGDGAFPDLELVQLIGGEAVEQIEAVGACYFQPAQVGPIDQPCRLGGRQVLLRRR